MIAGIHIEVLLAGGYSLFLAAVALVLELLARHSHRRTESIELAGFQYHHEHDAWECPTGQHLRRTETDPKRRVAVYRASSHICNGCGIKKNCTDSDEGRLIERPHESWIDSEIRRFHRGVSMALLVLAVVILAAEIFLVQRGADRLLLAGVLAPIGVFGGKLISEFWDHAAQKG